MDTGDLDLKYRPRTLDEVVGQDTTIKAIKSWKQIPRCVLLSGPAGCGKTTLARVISAQSFGLKDGDIDIQEVNCGALESPIGFVRELNSQTTSGGMAGGKRVWIFDEMQTFSKQKGAQEALLPILESSLTHNQYFICTTDPARLIKPVRSRCVEVALKPIKSADLDVLVRRIAKAEGITLSDDVVERIVENAAGGARDAVKGLQKVIDLKDQEEQLQALDGINAGGDVFEIVRALLYSGKPSWTKVAELLKTHEDADPEGVRMMIINAARTTLLKGGVAAGLAYKAIICFKDPLYERGSAKPLLAAFCYEFTGGK